MSAPADSNPVLGGYQPIDEDDANSLRPFVPTETLLEIDRLSQEASAIYKAKEQRYRNASSELVSIKLEMQNLRRRQKAAKAIQEDYFKTRFWEKVDAARQSAWAYAVQARYSAIESGQTLKFETQLECTARVNAARARQ